MLHTNLIPPPGVDTALIDNETGVNHIERIDDMFIDPETQIIHECVNGIWYTRDANGNRSRPKNQVINHQTIKDDNPYASLPREIINLILEERELFIVGSFESKVSQLQEYDRIMPDWLHYVRVHSIMTFHALSETQLYVFASLNKIPLAPLSGNVSKKDLVTYIRCYYCYKSTVQSEKLLFTGLLNFASDKVVKFLAVAFGVHTDHVDFIDAKTFRDAMLKDGINNIDYVKIQSKLERYLYLKRNPYNEQLRRLYDVRNDDDWKIISERDPHPIEQIIVNLNKYSDSEIINLLGMCVPLSHQNDVSGYILNNIADYLNLFARNNITYFPLELVATMDPSEIELYLSHFKDKEIFDYMGCYIKYNSRSELVNKMSRLFQSNKFIYPTIRSLDRSINRETTLLTSIEDVSTFMIAFGTPLRYHTYELEELIILFGPDEADGSYRYRRPDDHNESFDSVSICYLVELLSAFSRTEEITSLLRAIDKVKSETSNKVESDRQILNIFTMLTDDMKEAFKELLYIIFFSGMYMRRWKGPGHPYPLTTRDTEIKFDPEQNVLESLFRLDEVLNKLDTAARRLFNNIVVCEYNSSGRLKEGYNKFFLYLQGVKGINTNGMKTCIRMASRKFIGTAFHYLRVLYNEDIPNFTNIGVDRIQ